MCFDRWFELARSLGWLIRSWREEFGADAVVAMQCKPPFGGGCWFRRRCEIGRQTSPSLISVYVHVSLVSLSFCFVSMWFWFSLSLTHLGTHTHNQNPVEQCSSATTQQLATGLIPKIYLAKTVSESPKKREKPRRNGDTIAIGFETVRYHKPYNKGRHRLLLRHF